MKTFIYLLAPCRFLTAIDRITSSNLCLFTHFLHACQIKISQAPNLSSATTRGWFRMFIMCVHEIWINFYIASMIAGGKFPVWGGERAKGNFTLKPSPSHTNILLWLNLNRLIIREICFLTILQAKHCPPGMLPEHASFNREQSSLSLMLLCLLCFALKECYGTKQKMKKKRGGNLEQFHTTETNLIPLYW